MTERHCAECCYYLRHYTFDKKKIFRVYCGHCALFSLIRCRFVDKSNYIVSGKIIKTA